LQDEILDGNLTEAHTAGGDLVRPGGSGLRNG
jgi:hypothetical protein